MGNDDRDAVVVDAADAVTLNQDVPWERCAGLATPAGRRALAKLRALSRAFAGGRGTAEASMDPYAGLVVRRVLGVVIAIAAAEVGTALLLLPWTWDSYHRTHGDLAVFLTTLLGSHVATASLLLLASRGNQRTWLLGIYFLLMATLAPLHLFQAVLWEMPAPPQIETYILEMPAPSRLLAHACALPFMLAPAFMWAFARECPRVERRTRLDDLARRMIPGSVWLGCALWVACVVALEVARTGAAAAVFVVLDAPIAIVNVSAFVAGVVIALRAHRAPTEEVRRVVLFSAAFLLHMGVVVAYDIVELFSPGFWVSNFRVLPFTGLVELIRFPGMVLLWYSVLAVRVPHPREAVRASFRRLLTRRLLGAAAAAPAVALVWLLVSRPERRVGAFLADPLAQALGAAAGLVGLAAACRERILIRLDAWVYRDTVDQREALAAATEALARAAQIGPVSRTVTRAVERACGSPAALLVASDAERDAPDFSAPGAGIAPLARGRPSSTCWRRPAGRCASTRTTRCRCSRCFRLTTRRGPRRRPPTRWWRFPVPARSSSGCWWSAGASTIGSCGRSTSRSSRRWGRPRGRRLPACGRSARRPPRRWRRRRASARSAAAWRRPASRAAAAARRRTSGPGRRGCWRASTD